MLRLSGSLEMYRRFPPHVILNLMLSELLKADWQMYRNTLHWILNTTSRRAVVAMIPAYTVVKKSGILHSIVNGNILTLVKKDSE